MPIKRGKTYLDALVKAESVPANGELNPGQLT